MMLALRLAARELRGGVKGLRIVLACLALGVAAIAAVGSLRVAIERGLDAQSRQILGGDLDVHGGAQPLPDSLRAELRGMGARVSGIVQMRSMLVAPNGERQLVALKAVDGAWPLVGHAVLMPPRPAQQALARRNGRYGLLADQVVLDRLGLKPGDAVRLGEETFRVAGVLVSEPDRISGPSLLGSPVLISMAALPATKLVVPGSLLSHDLRAVLPQGTDPASVIGRLRSEYSNQGWRIRGAGDAAPALRRFIRQTALFMTLVGLTSLLVGGIGVAVGVRAWLEARALTIATLRCLGASTGLVFTVFLLQVLALAVAGILTGVIIGAALPLVLANVLRDALPIPPRLGLYPAPLLLAAGYGLLTAGTFALWPLGRAARIPGAALLRDAAVPLPGQVRPAILAGTAGLAAMLVALVVFSAPDRGFALWFCGAAAVTLLAFRLGGIGLIALAGRAPRLRTPWARLGLANLHRPGTAAPLMLVALGLGLSTLAAVALIEGNVRAEILGQMPAQAPSFYFIDIQDSQLPRFERILRQAPGVEAAQQVPSLRARIVAVNGVPADEVKATPQTRWALNGDRGLTYAATPPRGTRLVAGKWWPADYDGPPLVSFDAALARGWGVRLGDTITVNVLGRDIALKVASLRDIAWRSLSLNFVLVASPGLLAHAPHTHIATVRVRPADQGGLLRAITDALPNVTGIRVADVLAAVAALLGRIGAALAAVGSLTLASGALVLAGTMAAGQRRRVREAVILKTLGATRGQVRAAWLTEFGLIGLVAGLIAALVGTLASYGVVRFLMNTPWTFLPGVLAATILGCMALMLGFGYAGTAAALRARAAPLLRNE